MRAWPACTQLHGLLQAARAPHSPLAWTTPPSARPRPPHSPGPPAGAGLAMTHPAAHGSGQRRDSRYGARCWQSPPGEAATQQWNRKDSCRSMGTRPATLQIQALYMGCCLVSQPIRAPPPTYLGPQDGVSHQQLPLALDPRRGVGEHPGANRRPGDAVRSKQVGSESGRQAPQAMTVWQRAAQHQQPPPPTALLAPHLGSSCATVPAFRRQPPLSSTTMVPCVMASRRAAGRPAVSGVPWT